MITSRSRIWALVAVLLGVCILLLPFLLRFDLFPDFPIGGRPAAPEIVTVGPSITTAADLESISAGKEVPTLQVDRFYGYPLSEIDHLYGDPNAPITVLEYANFTNAFAAVAHAEIRRVLENYPGQVNWVFRHFPYEEMPYDWPAAIISECVAALAGNDAFWQYTDLVYQNQDFTEEDLMAYAQSLGVPAEQLLACRNDYSQAEIYVLTDAQGAAFLASVQVSPSFFYINRATEASRFVEGVDSYNYMTEILDEMLKEVE